MHLALFPRLWLDVHAAAHIDRKHIASLLCSSYTVDYVDAVLLDERSSLGVPAIHAFLKTFFPKLANHVLTEQTCLLIDNLVSSMTAKAVESVDVEASAQRLTGDLRALALVYSSSTRLKPPSTLLPALEALLSRTRTTTVKKNSSPEGETPSKKRKLNVSDDSEPADKDLCVQIKDVDVESSIPVETEDNKDNMKHDTMSSESVDDKAAVRQKPGSIQAETVATSISTVSSSLVTTANAYTNPLRCTLTNVSWLEMLESTIIDLQMIIQVQSKSN